MDGMSMVFHGIHLWMPLLITVNNVYMCINLYIRTLNLTVIFFSDGIVY